MSQEFSNLRESYYSKKESFFKNLNECNKPGSTQQSEPQNFGRNLDRERIVNIMNDIKRSTELQDEISKIEDHLNKRPPFLRVKQSKKKIISVSKHTFIQKYQKQSREYQRYGTHIYQNSLPKIDQNSQLPPSSSPYYNKHISSEGVFKILKSKIPNVPSSVQQKWKTNSFTTVSIATFGRRKFKINSISSLIASVNEINKTESSATNPQLENPQKQNEVLKQPLEQQIQPKFLAQNQEKISRTASDSGLKYLLSKRKSEDGAPAFTQTKEIEEKNMHQTSPSIDSMDGDFTNKIKAFFTVPQTNNKKCNQNLSKKNTNGLKQYFFSKKHNSAQQFSTSPKKKIIKKIDHQLQKTLERHPKKISVMKNAGVEFRKAMAIKGNMRQKWTSISQNSTSAVLNQNSRRLSAKKSSYHKPISTSCTPRDKKISLPEIALSKSSNKQASAKKSEQSHDGDKKANKFTKNLTGIPVKMFNSTVSGREQLIRNVHQSPCDSNIDCNNDTTKNCNSNSESFNSKKLLKSSINNSILARNDLLKGAIQKVTLK